MGKEGKTRVERRRSREALKAPKIEDGNQAVTGAVDYRR